tara:strand:- start:359 stop:1267 length:909 start_codon:yes stop_codon:yes gene_type:complete
MSTPRDTPFSKVNSKTQYGKTPLESWVGTVVSFETQKEQLDVGWGWRYKVRIMGDNTNSDSIKDENLDYAYVLLPTTAGSGASFKLRSVRISQGDFVYGVRGGGAGAPTIILGVFPRTSEQTAGSGKFANLSGFYGSLKKNKTLTGEFNEQIGPGTPGVTPLNPKTYNKSNAGDTSDTLSEVGYDRNRDGVIDDAEKKLTPLRTAENAPPKKDGSITSQQIRFMINNKSEVEVRDKIFDSKLSQAENDRNYQSYLIQQIDKGVEQNYFESSLAESAKRDIRKNRYDIASLRLFPPKPPINEG